MPRRIEVSEAKEKAGRFCAFQERSPKEVADKLKSWGLLESDIAEVVAFLLNESYIDPQRFANAFCNDKFEFNSWGKLKIRTGIYPHQLDAEVIERALDRIDSDKYFDRLLELTRKKWNSLKETDDLKRKQKTINYLSGKGFEQELIWKALDILAKGKGS